MKDRRILKAASTFTLIFTLTFANTNFVFAEGAASAGSVYGDYGTEDDSINYEESAIKSEHNDTENSYEGNISIASEISEFEDADNVSNETDTEELNAVSANESRTDDSFTDESKSLDEENKSAEEDFVKENSEDTDTSKDSKIEDTNSGSDTGSEKDGTEETGNPEYVMLYTEISDEELTYTGEPLTKASILVYGSITEEGVTKEVPLTEGTDYKIEYSDNVNAGTALITITGEGNYAEQKIEESFEILPAVITSADIKYNSMTYTGKVRTQTNATIVRCGDKILTKGTDYKITYENNIDPGTATMNIAGNGNYTGTITKTFSIRAKLSSVTLKYTSLRYTGKTRTLTNSTVVTAMINGESVILRKGVDYEITYKNNLNAGTATMIVTGIGDYKGTIKKQFKITPVTIKNASISTIAKLYTGSNITPSATVKAKVNGKTVKLQKGTDYTVTYKNNKNVGTATVTIKGTGNFTGTITKTFSIIQSKITGSGAKRVMSVAPVAAYGSLKVAVWTTKDGQDDIKWYTMKQYSSGNWKVAIKLSDFKDYGEVHAHVYSDAGFVCGEAFTISNADWLDAKSNAFKNNFLYNSGAYENIDYVQCAINIANNNYYGYGHTWRTNSHTISCAGLVGLSLTYCGYGDFIKDDPVEQLDGRRWGYIDLGTYSGKYNWMDVMMNEVGASWWSGISGIKIGDILYYDYGINNNHTAIYLGNGITVEARGPFGASDYDDSGVEVAVYYDGLSALPWQGYFSITNKRYI